IGTNDLSNGLDMSLSPNPTGSGNTDVRVTNEIFNFGNTHTFNFVEGQIENDPVTMVNVITQPANGSIDCSFLEYNPFVDWPGIAPAPWQLVVLHLQKEEMLENLRQQYQALIDGGNTYMMLSQIEMANYWEIIDLFNNLMDESPNLSEAALIAAIEQSLLPNSFLTQILNANPQASHSRDVMAALYNQRTLTPEEEAEILAGGATYSVMEQLRFAIDAVTRTSRLLLRDATALYFADSTMVHALDTVQDLYSNFWQPEDVYYRIQLCNGLTQATALLNDWPSEYELSTEEEEERIDMMYLLDVQNSLNEGDTLSATDETELMDILDKQHSFSSALASNLLILSAGYEEEENVTIPPNTGTLRSALVNEKSRRSSFALYPNPASDMTTLRMKQIVSTSHFVIQNALGEIVKTMNWPIGSSDVLLPLDELSAGIYSVVLYNGASQLQTLSLIKQ
ncbi:MAG: T9SS type A sorting domain-containing protein, partial [Flavobacteriales bacterium]